MKKEIGSIFPLSNKQILDASLEEGPFMGDRLFYSLCRETLYEIARFNEQSNKTVLIPSYTCQTVITPFEEAGWQTEFYPIKSDLRIDTKGFEEAVCQFTPFLVVVHPYFGMDLNAEEEAVLLRVKSRGVKIIVDLTQCLFSSRDYEYSNFTVASYRKWFPIPDGAYLFSKEKFRQPDTENVEFTYNATSAMYLRSCYFMNGEHLMKDISIRLSKTADLLAEKNISPHKMSQLSYNLLSAEDRMFNQKCRLANFAYLYRSIKETDDISRVCCDLELVTTAPLYFAIYVRRRKDLQRFLADNAVYAPVIWPVEDERVLINEETRYIYDHLLAIPCDQRYNKQDMYRIAAIINSFNNEK